MRVGSFKIETDSGQNLDISITTFPGDVGSCLRMSIAGLVKLIFPGRYKNLSKYRSKPLTIADQQGHLIEALGEQQGLLAGVFLKKNLAFKLIGDTELVEKESLIFCLSLSQSDAISNKYFMNISNKKPTGLGQSTKTFSFLLPIASLRFTLSPT